MEDPLWAKLLAFSIMPMMGTPWIVLGGFIYYAVEWVVETLSRALTEPR